MQRFRIVSETSVFVCFPLLAVDLGMVRFANERIQFNGKNGLIKMYSVCKCAVATSRERF